MQLEFIPIRERQVSRILPKESFALRVFLILFEPPSAATSPIELRGNRDQVGVRLAMSGFEIACRDLGSYHTSPRPTGRRTTSSWPSSSSNRISASSHVVPSIAAIAV